MVRNNYEDAVGTLNFLVRQVQLLQYQVMLNQTPFGEFRPEVPIARRMYRADAFAELRKTQDWLEMRGLNKSGTIAHEAATFLLKPEQYAAVLLLRHIVMEGDCYWAGESRDENPTNWELLVARGRPDEDPTLRFAELAIDRRYAGAINPRGDILTDVCRNKNQVPLVWKADAGSIEGWSMDVSGQRRMVRAKREALLESRNVQPA